MEKNKNYLEEYGTRRVIEPASVLPPSAWRLDNRREIYPDEIRIMVKRVHLEPTSFKQISLECGNDEAKMRRKILDITLRRGKLHNPITDTGGLLYGVVEEIGEDYPNEKNLKVGDEVICNASLSGIPTSFTSVGEIYRAFPSGGGGICHRLR